MTIGDLSVENSIVTETVLYGNSDVYTLTVQNPNPCHIYNVTMEILHFDKCTSSENVSTTVASFDGRKYSSVIILMPYSILVSILLEFPFKAVRDTLMVYYRPGESVVNVSFQVSTHNKLLQ